MQLTTGNKCWLSLPEVEESLNLGRLPSPKQERFDKWPENGVPKELSKNDSRINGSTDV